LTWHREVVTKRPPAKTLALPTIESFTEDEVLLAQVTIGIVREGGAMYTGRFLECVVGRLLEASFPVVGISPWDLLLRDGTRIEVRSGTVTFSLGGPKDVDLWIFVHKADEELLFSVATAAEVADLSRRTISARRLTKRFPPVGAAELPGAVSAVRSRS
jgi:hypothetical protein